MVLFLVLVGIMTVHNYTLGKTLVNDDTDFYRNAWSLFCGVLLLVFTVSVR